MSSSKALAAVLTTLAVTACAQSGKLAIRVVPGTLAQTVRPVPARIAEASGELALGNVALALESYRKALRDDPESIDARKGMAACYQRMGRFDLAQRYLEAALALAPSDPHLLGALAGSFTQQGRTAEAQAVRQEIASRAADPTGTILTVALPAARGVVRQRELAANEVAPPSVASPSGPRLERLSLGEVALVTRPVVQMQLPRATGLAQSSLLPVGVARSLVSDQLRRPLLVLNAARSRGIASRTGRLLTARGFGAAIVGNSPRVLARTIIIAPATERVRAMRLASLLPVTARTVNGSRLTLVLGRDAAAVRTPIG